MTDIISNIKLQSKSTSSNRRVCLQQSRTPLNASLSTEVPSNFLLMNNGIKSIKKACVTPSSLSKTTQITSLKPSLKQNNNIPTTATTIKSVRFNFPLAQILHFYTPSVDEDDDSCDEEEEEYFDNDEPEEEIKLEDAFLELFSSRFSSSDYDSNLYHPAIQQHILDDASSHRLTMITLNWPTMHPTKRFISQMVSLEGLSWDNARSTIKGRVLVHNLAYQKRVTIRMSFNHWQTWVDVDAIYKESSKGDTLDRFTFEFVTPNHLSYINRICSTSTCSLAVRYQVNGREFWDNNNRENFSLNWTTTTAYASGNNNGKIMQNEEMAFAINGKYSVPITSSKDQVISLYQQGRYGTTLITARYCQEEDIKQMKKEEYYIPLTSIQSTALSNHYITPSTPLSITTTSEQQTFLSVSTTQQQISAHFQLYLERKKRSEERQRIKSDNTTSITSTSSPSSHLMTSASNGQAILFT